LFHGAAFQLHVLRQGDGPDVVLNVKF
jgi:hypothetical protein